MIVHTKKSLIRDNFSIFVHNKYGRGCMLSNSTVSAPWLAQRVPRRWRLRGHWFDSWRCVLHATVRGRAATFSFAQARWFGVVAAIFFCVRCLGALVWRRGAHFFRRFKLARLLPRQFFSLRARVRWPPLLKSEDHLNAWSRTRTT